MIKYDETKSKNLTQFYKNPSSLYENKAVTFKIQFTKSIHFCSYSREDWSITVFLFLQCTTEIAEYKV